MDIIFIKGLVVSSIIGIYDWERCVFQKLIFDLDIGYHNDRLSINRNVNINDFNYIDYQKISNFVNFLVTKKCFFLVESVAETVATELMLYFNIPWVRVKVSKVGAVSKFVNVGVIIERGIK